MRNEYTSSHNSQGLRLQFSKSEVNNILQNFLNANKLQYYTYHASNRNLIKAIIRGLPPNLNEEEILSELQGNQLPAISVRQFRRTQEDSFTEVQTKKSPSHMVSYIDQRSRSTRENKPDNRILEP